MPFRSYSTNPALNTNLTDGTYIGPNMARNKVRPALQQLAADGRTMADELVQVAPLAANAVSAASTASQQAGVATASASTATTAASTATAAQTGTLAALTGAKITTDVTIAPVSVAALQALTTMVEGTTAYLREAGRAGIFVFSTANHSANVTADPYQGIYIPPAATPGGGSGAWVRRPTDAPYLASFWGCSPAVVNNGQRLTSAFALLPEGATILVEALLPTSSDGATAGVSIIKAGQQLIGGGKTTGLIGNNHAAHVVRLGKSGCRVANMRLSGTTGQGYLAEASGVHIHPDIGENIEGCVVDGCWIDNCDSGVVVGWNQSGTDPTYWRANKCHVRFNIMNVGGIGVEVFAADDAHVHDNSISIGTGNNSVTLFTGVRLVGCRRAHVHHNKIYNVDETLDNRYGILVAAANSDSSRTDTLISSKNHTIDHNHVHRFFRGIGVSSCVGFCRIINNVIVGHTDAYTSAIYNITLEYNSSVLQDMTTKAQADIIEVRGNTAFRIATFFVTHGRVLHSIVKNNTHVGNGHTESRFALYQGAYNDLERHFMSEIEHNYSLTNRLVTVGGIFVSSRAGETHFISYNKSSGDSIGRIAVKDGLGTFTEVAGTNVLLPASQWTDHFNPPRDHA